MLATLARAASRLAGSPNWSMAASAWLSSRSRTVTSASALAWWRTAATKSQVGSSASRVMSHSAAQQRERGSGSARPPRWSSMVRNEVGSKRSLAKVRSSSLTTARSGACSFASAAMAAVSPWPPLSTRREGPLRRPGGEVPPGGGLDAGEELAERRVAPAVALEVLAQPVREGGVTDPGDQLLEDRRPLLVGDA